MTSNNATFQEIVSALDIIGIAVFAISGALVAARRQMDPIGFIIVGTATAIGGGTLRDLVLGVHPVFWVSDSTFLVISFTVSLATFWLARPLTRLYPVLVWLDAIGMALFAVTGTQKAASLGASPVVAIFMGVMTASFGGLMRDVLCGEKPLLFHREIYASAAIVGGAVWLGSAWLPLVQESRFGIAFLAAFGVRAAAIIWKIGLPPYRQP